VCGRRPDQRDYALPKRQGVVRARALIILLMITGGQQWHTGHRHRVRTLGRYSDTVVADVLPEAKFASASEAEREGTRFSAFVGDGIQ